MKYEITVFPGVKKTENPRIVDGQRYVFRDFAHLSRGITKIAWSSGLFTNDYRNKANFECANVIGLDFDDGLSMNDVAKRLAALGLTYSITLTRHHQKPKPQKQGRPDKPACDRFRVVIPLEEPITNAEDFEATWSYLYEKFPEIDTACKDPSRLFFASIQGPWEGL